MNVYELWHMDTGNLSGEFDSEAQALAAIRDALTRHGHAYTVQFDLVLCDATGDRNSLAAGEALSASALSSPAPV